MQPWQSSPHWHVSRAVWSEFLEEGPDELYRHLELNTFCIRVEQEWKVPSPEALVQRLFAGYQGKRPAALDEWLVDMTVEFAEPEMLDWFVAQTLPLGWRVIGMLKDFGVTVALVNDAEYRAENPGFAAHYEPWRRRVVLPRFALSTRPGMCVARHEMGHGVDHLLSRLFLGRKFGAASRYFWDLFMPQRSGFITDYAGSRPPEYLAESIEAWFEDVDRPRLQAMDRGMSRFLQLLFEASGA